MDHKFKFLKISLLFSFLAFFIVTPVKACGGPNATCSSQPGYECCPTFTCVSGTCQASSQQSPSLLQFTGIGPLGDTSLAGTDMYTRFENVISTILAVITIFAGIWFLIQFFVAAFNWISAGSDKSALEKAQKRMTHAIIGLFLVVFAYGFTALISLVLGLNILKPGTTLENLPH